MDTKTIRQLKGPEQAQEQRPAKGKRWDWLPQHMPRVAALIREKRTVWGDAWINRCWEQGVVNGQPGWLFAREGPLSVGVPWADEDVQTFAQMFLTPTQALLLIRPPEAAPELQAEGVSRTSEAQ